MDARSPYEKYLYFAGAVSVYVRERADKNGGKHAWNLVRMEEIKDALRENFQRLDPQDKDPALLLRKFIEHYNVDKLDANNYPDVDDALVAETAKRAILIAISPPTTKREVTLDTDGGDEIPYRRAIKPAAAATLSKK